LRTSAKALREIEERRMEKPIDEPAGPELIFDPAVRSFVRRASHADTFEADEEVDAGVDDRLTLMRRTAVILFDPILLVVATLGTLFAASVLIGNESCSSNDQAPMNLFYASIALAAAAGLSFGSRPGRRTGSGRTLIHPRDRLLGAIIPGGMSGALWLVAGGFILFFVAASRCPFLNF
jgi:hypothetical protein